MLQAYRKGTSIAPLKAWRGASARILAGGLAYNVGSPKLARALHGLAWREHPDDPEAAYYGARHQLDRRGPLAAWEFMKRVGDLPDAPAKHRSDWLSFHCNVLVIFRDFEAARSFIERAEAIAPDRAWLQVERCGLHLAEDRYPEALAAAKRALEMRPWYRPGIQCLAHVL